VTPTTTKALTEAGYNINVEHSSARMFGDEEFAATGANLVATGSWTSAPDDHIIVGLKEIPNDTCESSIFAALPDTSGSVKTNE
jgi:saccharopine dehydrogenase (NAD+, L-lysine forming)